MIHQHQIINRSTDCTLVKRVRYLLLFCIQFFYFVISYAQQSPVKFTHLTNLDGLSQSTVQAILKDKYGFMWFGTQDGLNRYDGYSFKIYRHMPDDSTSLRKSHITSLYEDRKGNLWVGTSNGALSLYDRQHDSFIHFKESKNNYAGLSQASVTAIYEDRQNNFWVGTYWKLNLLDRQTGKIIQFANDSSDPQSISGDGITSIFEDSKNNLWIGTSNGLNILDRKTKKFHRYIHDNTRPGSLSNNRVRAINEDNHGRVWIGTDDGLNLFDPATGTFSYYKKEENNPATITDNGIRAIENAVDEKIWIATATSLELFEPATGLFTHFKNNPTDPTSMNRDGTVMSMLCDKEGTLWVGTYQGGLNKYDKYLTYFDTHKNNPYDVQSLSFNIITSFAENRDGDIWVATGGGALNLWKRQTNQFIRFNPDPDNKNSLSNWGLLALCHSKKNDYLWIGTYGRGIDRYDPKTNTFKHYVKGDGRDQLNNDAVYALLEDSRGNIWIGTNGGGVNVLNPATGNITKYVTDPNNPVAVCGNFVRCFYEDKKGKVWIGTSTGISAFDPATSIFTRYDQNNTELESDFIYSIFQDTKGHIWIGTLGGGLNRLDPATGKIVIYSTNDGLPDNTINCITEDDKGYLWLSTNNGISRFDQEHRTFKNSGPLNGIQSFEFSQGAGLRTSKGEILFGGVNGFNVIHPNNLMENRNIPHVVMTGFKLFNKTVSVNDKNSPLTQDITCVKEITLSYEQSIITLEFAALGYTASEKNQYAFILDGFETEWNNVGYQHTATYTNLDPGTYTFKVKASNNDGLWNQKETTIKLIITPPFWLTWWFKIAVLLVIGGGIISIYLVRITAVKRQRKNLEQKVKEQTIQLVHANEEEHKARLEADHANEELGKKNKELEQFVYMASHDLREPLRTTSGFVDLFQKQYKGKLDEKADTYLSYITQASARMTRLIDELLDYSRIESKKELEQVDCNIILQEVLSDLGKVISEAKAEIEAGHLPVINAHTTSIKQLFQNLIANAIKFRKKDTTPKIQIASESNNDVWKFLFTDNGIGIEQKNSEKIFAIFERLHTRKEYDGSGIGLAHCKKIVELHKGNIWVKSELGKGTTFYFTIPQDIN